MKVGIVGSGAVGATAAYALVMRGSCREVILVDQNPARAAAEADDIRHAVPFSHPVAVAAGGYGDLRGARVVLLCAGVGQKPGETRLQLLQRNAAVFADVVPQVLQNAPEAVLVVATNPVDIMTHLAADYARQQGGDPRRVLGSGTTLDTARFRSLVGERCGVDPHHVHGYVVGEHGDSEVLTWSLTTIGGMPLVAFAKQRGIEFTPELCEEIDAKVRGAAYSIIRGKGATSYGIGCALARITESVLNDQRTILTVCALTPDVFGVKNVTVSFPRLVGGAGVLETFPLPLKDPERRELRASANVIKEALDALAGKPPASDTESPLS